MQHLGSDRDRQGGDVKVGIDVIPPFITHPVEQDLLHGKTSPEESGIFAIARDEPVALVQRIGGTERGGFLTAVLRVRPHSTRSLQLEGDFIELPAQHHVPVQLDGIVIRYQSCTK